MKFRSIPKNIASDKIDNVFDAFELFFRNISDIEKQILIIQSNHTSLDNKKTSHLIKLDDYTIAKNKITDSIIKVFSQIETLVEEEPDDTPNPDSESTNKPQTIKNIVQSAVTGKGYEIESQIFSDHTSYYFKAKKNSLVQKDYYVIQVLNTYKLSNSQLKYNQSYLNYFSHPPQPFVKIFELFPGTPSYIIRKYADGIDLNNLIQSGIKLSLLKSLEVIITISKGLKNLYDEQIFYNNLIPDQIILDNNLDLHVLPLNIFEENADAVTWKNLKDAIKFMSPEQLKLAGNKTEQNKLSVSSNQFTLGLILFFVFTGESLFDGNGLPSLYEDRIDQADTKQQLEIFYKSFHNKLLQYEISKKIAKEILNEFVSIFEKLVQKDISDRYPRFDDFISSLEFLKLRIERDKKESEGQFLYHVTDSYSRSNRINDNLIDHIYEALEAELPSNKSMKDVNERNIRFQFALNYLFTSISNLENASYLKESLVCFVNHFDFAVEDYEIFFKILKENVSKNDSYWNDLIDEAWNYFIEQTMDAIDSLFTPIK